MSEAANRETAPAIAEAVCASCGKAVPAWAKFCSRCSQPLARSADPSSGRPNDFFISYTGVDVDWAQWIARQVEAAGYTTIYQARDFPPGGNFVAQMQQAMQQSRRTMAVLSPEYLEARFTLPEWAEAFRRDPTGEHALLVPVRVKACNLAGLLGARVYIDLVGKEEAAASAWLVEQVRRVEGMPLPLPAAPFPGVVAEAAARPLVAAPTGLPLAASLIGRDEALAELMAQLRAGTTSGVFALEGMGGVGKTALAAEAVARLAEDVQAFPGGAAWIACEELKGEAGLAELWTKVALALGLEQVTAQPDPQKRRVLLGAALMQQQRLLLALDNIEPGLDAEAVLETLSVRNHTALLLTARQRIAPHRVAAIDLAPLPPEGSRALFLEHLERNGGTLPIPAEEPALATLLEAVGGLPLALELTAAYVGVQRLALERALREVEQDGLNAAAFRADPKRALLKRFESSWQVLSASQQRLFAGLSLLAGVSFPREAALAVGHATAAKRAADQAGDLARLVSYALVEVLPGGERLRLHPLLREYAVGKLKRLPPTQQERLGEAMVTYWLAYARAHPGYAGMDALETEAPGLLGALEWAHDHADHKDLLWLANALFTAWRTRGRRDEQLRIFTWAVQAAEAQDDPTKQCWAVHQLAVTHADIGQLEEARAGYERALDLARQLDDLAAEQLEVHSLAVLDGEIGWLEEARAGFEQALKLARHLGDAAAELADVYQLAMSDFKTGRFVEARAGYERALDLARHLRDPVAEQRAVHDLAVLDDETGRFVEARAGYERALDLARALGNPAAESVGLLSLGFYLSKRGEVERGCEMIKQSLAISERLSDVFIIGTGHEYLAWLERDAGNTEAAIAHYRGALRCFEQVESPVAEKVRADLQQLEEGEEA